MLGFAMLFVGVIIGAVGVVAYFVKNYDPYNPRK